ncbi:MAG: phosphoribosylanthranilate isomerase [Ectothiorhodospiraceae bacterium]|nr:phosphoribosylanthranilate isomerase [Ectothiorhodospiraceae bacterium]MCH8504554.1 phosphoribosylanthranilate isomerase [Ectothiorhodospiraceae bacterium]
MRTRVKICGLTRVEDALEASRLGVDAVGLVFYAGSRRAVGLEQAAAIVAALPPFVSVVPLFLNPDRELVRQVLESVPVDLLQFHGEEPPEFCEGFGRRYLKAVPMGGQDGPVAYARRYRHAAGFLLDSHEPGAPGGSGKVFDWRAIPGDLGRPLIIAGGLKADNVGEAIRRYRPWGVDVSSGVESAPGIKDAGAMATFINEVQRVQ